MKLFYITILLILSLIQIVYSQDKTVKGDTAFLYSRHQRLIKKLELTDFSKLTADFAFRFINQGQVVEIINDRGQLSGELTNYIFRLNRQNGNRRDTIFNKIKIDTSKVSELYAIIQNAEILKLQSCNEIEGWSQGCDGVTYIIEHADSSNYWFKNYWTPSAQHSIPESIIVKDFVKTFSDTLDLTQIYKRFRESLPRNGCYSSGMSLVCYIGNSIGFGYHSSTKLPIGYNASVNLTYIGKLRANVGINLYHQFDKHRNYDFMIVLGKGNLFFNRNYKIQDFINYQYRKNELQFLEPDIVFNDHQFYYGLSFKRNLDIAVGVDYLLGENKTIGGILYVSQWIDKPGISLMGKSSLFENHVDYQIGISKSFNFNLRFPVSSTTIGMYYESFKGYNDLYFSLKFWI